MIGLLFLIFLHHLSSIFFGHCLELYWAVPSQPCLNRSNPTIDPTLFGIRTNRGQKFHGSEIVIFYESQLGLYPYIEEENEEATMEGSEKEATLGTKGENGTRSISRRVNGGLPQTADLHAHLEKARAEILAAIPDPDFAGPVVIDYERWRPEWSLNWGARRIYQVESRRDALERFPGISEKAAIEIGREMFNKRARKFIVQTIRLGRRLRPKAFWGFYDTPLCNYDAGERWGIGCREQFKKHNDKLVVGQNGHFILFCPFGLWWLYAEVGALYSSIYLHPADRKRKSIAACERHMQAKMAEAEWIWSLRRKDRPIILFTKMELNPYSAEGEKDIFYSKEELVCSYEWTAQLGVDALVVWSTSQKMKQRCQPIAEYLHQIFGPFVLELRERAQDCSQRICHGRGRCVLRDRRRQRKPWPDAEPWPRHKFTCICPRDNNFYGEYCDLAGPVQ